MSADSLRVDCLLVKPVDFNWSEGYGESWEIVQPYEEEDFIDPVAPGDWRENEEKRGFASYESMLDNNQPMMSYYYPLGSAFDEYDPKKLRHLNLCLVYFIESGEYALALTGGGMDFSWDICTGYIHLGFYPPTHFRLPNFAGMVGDEFKRFVVESCIKGREIVKGWMDNDIRSLQHVLSELEPKYDSESE